MASARLIVCETTSKWAVALRRQTPSGLACEICETRSLVDCWRMASDGLAGGVVLEVTNANLERLAAELLKYRARLPRVPVMVVGHRDLAAVEWLMRELGAIHTVFSSRALEPLMRILHRHCRGMGQAESVETEPWKQLPWGSGQERRVAREYAVPLWLTGADRLGERPSRYRNDHRPAEEG